MCHENSDNIVMSESDMKNWADELNNDEFLDWLDDIEFVETNLKLAQRLHNEITEWINFSNIL